MSLIRKKMRFQFHNFLLVPTIFAVQSWNNVEWDYHTKSCIQRVKSLASDILTTADLGDDMSSTRPQAITWTNADLLSVFPYAVMIL